MYYGFIAIAFLAGFAGFTLSWGVPMVSTNKEDCPHDKTKERLTIKVSPSILHFAEKYKIEILVIYTIIAGALGWAATYPYPFSWICLFCIAISIICYIERALNKTNPTDRRKEGKKQHETQTKHKKVLNK